MGKKKGSWFSRLFSGSDTQAKPTKKSARGRPAGAMSTAKSVKPAGAKAPPAASPAQPTARPTAAVGSMESKRSAQVTILQPPAQPAPIVQQLFDELNLLARNPDTTIDVEAAQKWVEEAHPAILDVRPADMYRQAHVPGATSAPLADLKGHLDDLPKNKAAPVLTVCQRGNASLLAMIYLRGLGYTNVKSLNGGTSAWQEKGLQVEARP